MQFFLGCVLPYLAFAVFLAGMAWRTWNWLRRPVPFAITLYPAQSRPAARVAAAAKELLLFRSLYHGDRGLWLWAWLMHFSLALIVVGHVVGLSLVGRQFCYLGASAETSTFMSGLIGTTTGLVFAVSLLALFYRRTAVPEAKRLSDPADYFALALLLAVAVTGLHMRLAWLAADQAEVRSYLAGLLTFRPVPLPREPIFVVHFTLVSVLLLYFPFSKLVHLTGAFASQALLLQSPPVYPTPAGAAQERRPAAVFGGDAP